MSTQAQNINNTKRMSKPTPAYLGEYRVLCQVGEGTYGKVYKAQHRVSNKVVALKVLFPDSTTEEDGGISVTTLREVKYLQSLAGQPNIINFGGCFFTPDQELVLIFEYMEHDLSGLISHPDVRFSPIDVKFIMKQILEGLHQIHTAEVMHRDIKAANILLNSENSVKIGDFGLATNYKRRPEFSTNVVTLWYRAPEVLLGQVKYTPKVDMWSAGCIFVELMEKRSPLPGKNEFNQMELIFKLCGFPNEHNWPGVSKLPEYKKLEGLPHYLNKMDDVFKHYPPKALDLLKRLLTPDPQKRISACDALDHDFFWTEEPFLPTSDSAMKFSYWIPSVHEYELRMQEQQARNSIQSHVNHTHHNTHPQTAQYQVPQHPTQRIPQQQQQHYVYPPVSSYSNPHQTERAHNTNTMTANQRISSTQQSRSKTAATLASSLHKNGVKTEAMKKVLPTRNTSESTLLKTLVQESEIHARQYSRHSSQAVNQNQKQSTASRDVPSNPASTVVKFKLASEQDGVLGKRKRTEVSV